MSSPVAYPLIGVFLIVSCFSTGNPSISFTFSNLSMVYIMLSSSSISILAPIKLFPSSSTFFIWIFVKFPSNSFSTRTSASPVNVVASSSISSNVAV